MSIRPVKQVIQAQPTLEGAGVHLRRAFGFGKTEEFDPFLLLDDFRNERPEDYLRGFPWHPHRGIETITYVLAGNVEHADSLGNQGAIGAGSSNPTIRANTAPTVEIEGKVQRKVKVGEPVELGGSAAIYGKDPFGNIIEIYEIRDPDIAQLS